MRADHRHRDESGVSTAPWAMPDDRRECMRRNLPARQPSWNQPQLPNFQERFQEEAKRAVDPPSKSLMQMVGRDGFEPSTKRLKVFCSTN